MQQNSLLFILFEIIKTLFPSYEFQNMYLMALLFGFFCFILIFLISLIKLLNIKLYKKYLIYSLIPLFIVLSYFVYHYKASIERTIIQNLNISFNSFLEILIFSILVLIIIANLLKHPSKTKAEKKGSKLNENQFSITITVFSFLAIIFLIMFKLSYGFFVGVFNSLFLIAELISVLLWFYNPIIYILSRLFNIKAKPPHSETHGKMNRLAVIICAHNEEKVVGNLIKSIYATDYPENKYDVYVICDNCTDKTAEIVRRSGANAMERFDETKKGKGYCLEWMFNILKKKSKFGNKYDAYIILDADNLVNKQYLYIINQHLNEGHEILQTYLGVKNPYDTWISKSYSMSYWVSNSNFQEAHSLVGLSAQMGGTGMVIRPNVLDEIGWRTDSLTEDLVLTVRYVLEKNSPCHWVHDAKIYDEKPLGLIQSITQRTRWMQGQFDAVLKYAPKLLLNGIKKFSLRQLDVALYLVLPTINLFLFIIYAIRLGFCIVDPIQFINLSFIMNINAAIIITSIYLMMELYIFIEKSSLRTIFWIPIQLVFSFSWYTPIFRGILKHKEINWVSTLHKRAIDIEELELTEQNTVQSIKSLNTIEAKKQLSKLREEFSEFIEFKDIKKK